MIVRCLWRIIGGVSRRSLVGPVRERGIKNRIVRGWLVWCCVCGMGIGGSARVRVSIWVVEGSDCIPRRFGDGYEVRAKGSSRLPCV
jgi:hypothetical protein